MFEVCSREQLSPGSRQGSGRLEPTGNIALAQTAGLQRIACGSKAVPRDPTARGRITGASTAARVVAFYVTIRMINLG
jgi:hypothetical protein